MIGYEPLRISYALLYDLIVNLIMSLFFLILRDFYRRFDELLILLIRVPQPLYCDIEGVFIYPNLPTGTPKPNLY